MSILNATQQRHLYFGLMHLDKQLCDLEDILNQAQTPPMFPRFRHDITPELQREIETGVAAIRAAMRQLMQSEELTPEAAGLGALQGIRSQLTFAEIGIEELGPRNMRGYGALDDLPAQALEEMVSGLRAPVSAG